jgi:hypothetical protein
LDIQITTGHSENELRFAFKEVHNLIRITKLEKTKSKEFKQFSGFFRTPYIESDRQIT